MIEIEIPNDVRKYDSKLIGPFTARQAICAVVGGIIVFAGLQIFSFLPTDMKMVLSMLLASPALLLGWYKPFGMKLEDFLKTAFISAMLSPKHRVYKTENIYAENEVPEDAQKTKNQKKSKAPVSKSAYK